MAFKVRKTGAWADTGTVKVMKTGSWSTAGFVKARKSGVWSLVWPSLIASVSNHNVVASGVSAGGATAGYKIDSDGSVYEKIGTGSDSLVETWLDAGANTNFEVRFTQTSSNGIGSLTGTLNTWLATTSDNSLSLGGAGVGQTASRGITVEIRETVTNTTLTTATVQLDAERL